MNRFELAGAITSIEEKLTKKNTPFHLVTIADDEGIEIQTALFGRAPRVGDHIELSGHLISRNGFLNLAIEDTRGDLCSNARNPIDFVGKADGDRHPLPDLRQSGRWRPPPPMEKRGWSRGEAPAATSFMPKERNKRGECRKRCSRLRDR